MSSRCVNSVFSTCRNNDVKFSITCLFPNSYTCQIKLNSTNDQKQNNFEKQVTFNILTFHFAEKFIIKIYSKHLETKIR